MKTIFLPILAFILILPVYIVHAENSHEYTEARLEWSQHNFGITNGTGTAKIILTDFDVPNIPTYIDRVTVFVHSDSSQEGINLTLYETGKNSGIFERSFSLSDTRSAPSVLLAHEGDTAIVEYLDDTLPSDHEFSKINLRETTLIGLLGYPIERLPATNPRIVDLDGNRLNFPILGGQILLQSDIANQQDVSQKFIWLAQTVDSQKRIESLSWINGTINPRSSFSPSTSLIPASAGEYRTTFFVWESIDNPTALSPPVEMWYAVVSESDTHILKYSPVLFSGTGVDLQGDDLIQHLKNKREQLDISFDDSGTKRLHPIVGMSFSIGNNAYSLDEKYVGSPIALEIRVLKAEFTKETLEEINRLVRMYIGDEIDVVYSKGVYAVPTPIVDEK